MKSHFHVALLSGLGLIVGCSAYHVDSQIEAGRRELLIGKSVSAAGYFQEAAQLDSNYAKDIGYMREGVWTYLGRADYDVGNLAEARQVLERAAASDRRDYLANLYLGLALAKSGERQNGAEELKRGLDGLDEWFRYTTDNSFYAQFWDPSGTIRTEIGTDLAMLSASEIDWPKLIASGEWIGKKTEEEIDLARRDERRLYESDGQSRTNRD